MGLVLREVKGSKLTIQEMDGNLTYLDGGITANTQNINAKLNVSDFNSYSSNTNTLIGTKLNVTDFNTYSSTTNTLINSKLNLTDFNIYSSTTNTLIGTKLNVTDFNTYSSTTNTLINSKLNLTDFNTYSSTTNTRINNKLDATIFAAYTATTMSSVSGVTYGEFFAYTAATNTRINNKLDTTIFATYTASTAASVSGVTYSEFFAYTAATNTRINNKLDTSIYTAFTSGFYTYTSTTNTLINNRLLTTTFATFTGTTLPVTYFRQGGNSYSATALLGTNDVQSLALETNASVRMTIASGGNVGINTTPSSSRLELYQSGGTVFNVGGGVGNLFTVNDSNVGNLLTVQDVSGNTIFLTTSSGQSGFNTSAVTQSAQVQIDSTTRGFLPPRMTGAQAEAIPSPAEGLMVYATISGTTITSKGWWGYDGSTWVKLN
jgi:hypothetical protein